MVLWGLCPVKANIPTGIDCARIPSHTCATESHNAHRNQVDGVRLPMGEKVQPDVANADEKKRAKSKEVAWVQGETREKNAILEKENPLLCGFRNHRFPLLLEMELC